MTGAPQTNTAGSRQRTRHRAREAAVQMLYQWEGVLLSVGASKRFHEEGSATSWLRRSARLLGAGIIGIQVYAFLMIINLHRFSFSILIAYLCLPLSVACLVWWLGALKKDTCKFANAVQALRAPQAPSTARDPFTHRFGLAILAIATILFAWYIFEATSTLRFMGLKNSVIFLSTFLWMGLALFPFYWLVLVVWDLEQAAAGLEACGELQGQAANDGTRRVSVGINVGRPD